jgi:ATP-dependent protease HslVU (ClpYQ) peptidase subunit
MRAPVFEATGNVVIEWTSMVTVGNKKVKFQANSKLQRINNKFVILTFGAIEPKFTEMKDFFVKIANSQIVNASLSIPLNSQ